MAGTVTDSSSLDSIFYYRITIINRCQTRDAACRTAPVRFTTYLKTAETGGYVPLAREVDLRTLAGSEDIVAKIAECR
jgi:hypothetical protein